MKKFDFYEFTGVLLPGAILLFGVSRIYPLADILGSAKDFTVGEFGLFVILAYTAGHIIQTLGNAIETLWWRCAGGMPSDWVRSRKHRLLALQQESQLLSKLREVTKQPGLESLPSLTADAWYSITRQIYAAVRRTGLHERIDTFNGNYGMFRGISASLLVLIVAAILEGWPPNWRLIGVLSIAALCSLLRMHRFGKVYAREVFVQFLGLQADEPTRAPKKEESE